MSALGICLLTFGGCLAGSLLPFLSSELLILSMAALAPPEALIPIVLCAASGQIAGKVVLYLAGQGSLNFSRARENPRVAPMLARLEARRNTSGLVLFASASTGLPPLFVMSVACGMLRMGLARFVTLGLVGRIIRFWLVVQLPHLFSLALP